MNWQDYIHTDPNILLGRPSFKGTRLGVDDVLTRLAAGWSVEEILQQYPRLTPFHLQALFQMVNELLKNQPLTSLQYAGTLAA